MASQQALVFRWGIISTGSIATKFIKDIIIDPKTRDVHDVSHKVVAVGSRSVASAQQFIDEKAGGDRSIKAYGSYDEVFADSEVDAVYIGTPHTCHYSNAKSAILAKKHVLLEKPATSNAAEFKSLVALAKESNVFLMEAMWTRFQPAVKEIRALIDGGSLGDPVIVHADLSVDFDYESLPLTHRMLDPKLGGGSILDLGPYPLVWAIIALYEHPSNKSQPPVGITASMVKTASTGVDASTSFTLSFPKIPALASLFCSMAINNIPTESAVSIRFRRGNILIPGPSYCPKEYTVQWMNKDGKIEKTETKEFSWEGGGWHFQADEVARCVGEGKNQSDLWGWDKTVMAMEIFDEIRKQGGYSLPEGVEQVV